MSNNLETRIRNAMCEELQLYENQGHLCFIKNNTGMVKSTYTNKYSEIKHRAFKYGRVGSSDIIIFTKDKPIFIEVKVKKNTLSDSQKEFKALVEKMGLEYVVMREDYDLRDFLKKRCII